MNHIQRCLILSFFLFSISIVAQETEENLIKSEDSLKLNHFALGIKIGIPNIVGGSWNHSVFIYAIIFTHFVMSREIKTWGIILSGIHHALLNRSV